MRPSRASIPRAPSSPAARNASARRRIGVVAVMRRAAAGTRRPPCRWPSTEPDLVGQRHAAVAGLELAVVERPRFARRVGRVVVRPAPPSAAPPAPVGWPEALACMARWRDFLVRGVGRRLCCRSRCRCGCPRGCGGGRPARPACARSEHCRCGCVMSHWPRGERPAITRDASIAERASCAGPPPTARSSRRRTAAPRRRWRRASLAIRPPAISKPDRVGARVKIWITPPIASEPYRLDRLPARSRRARSSRATRRRAPQRRSAPCSVARRRSAQRLAGVGARREERGLAARSPVRANSTPACRPSSSISPGVCDDSIWLRVITVADGSESASRCSVRVAVTSTSSSA